MSALYDIASFGNGIVDLLVHVEDDLIKKLNLDKGHVQFVDDKKAKELLDTLSTFTIEKRVGGSALNTIRISAELGLKNYFSTMVGNDKLGKLLIGELHRLNIAEDITKTDSRQTGTVVSLITPDGERTMVCNLAAAEEYSIEQAKPEQVADARLFYFTAYKLTTQKMTEVIKKAIEIAKKNNVLVAFDVADGMVVSNYKAEIEKLIPKCDILFMNEDEAITLCGSVNKTIEAYSNAVKTIIVKLGKNGCIINDGKGNLKRTVHGFPVKPLDTTGAGDSFAAGFLYGYLNGLSNDNCAKLGNFIGSKLVQNLGPVLSEENIKEIKELISTLK